MCQSSGSRKSGAKHVMEKGIMVHAPKRAVFTRHACCYHCRTTQSAERSSSSVLLACVAATQGGFVCPFHPQRRPASGKGGLPTDTSLYAGPIGSTICCYAATKLQVTFTNSFGTNLSTPYTKLSGTATNSSRTPPSLPHSAELLVVHLRSEKTQKLEQCWSGVGWFGLCSPRQTTLRLTACECGRKVEGRMSGCEEKEVTGCRDEGMLVQQAISGALSDLQDIEHSMSVWTQRARCILAELAAALPADQTDAKIAFTLCNAAVFPRRLANFRFTALVLCAKWKASGEKRAGLLSVADSWCGGGAAVEAAARGGAGPAAAGRGGVPGLPRAL
eukprot:2748279-Rhodomonas_salina.2